MSRKVLITAWSDCNCQAQLVLDSLVRLSPMPVALRHHGHNHYHIIFIEEASHDEGGADMVILTSR